MAARADSRAVQRCIRAAIACLILLGTAACASRGGHVPAPFPRPGNPVDWSPSRPAIPKAPGSASPIINTALSLRGSPSTAGGAAPSGFDCSGFTRYVFAQHGVQLPRTSADQYREGHSVDPDELQPGDLVFFATSGPGPSHVGVAIGDGQFVHAPNRRSSVRIDALDARYWRRRFLGVRRYVPTS